MPRPDAEEIPVRRQERTQKDRFHRHEPHHAADPRHPALFPVDHQRHGLYRPQIDIDDTRGRRAARGIHHPREKGRRPRAVPGTVQEPCDRVLIGVPVHIRPYHARCRHIHSALFRHDL